MSDSIIKCDGKTHKNACLLYALRSALRLESDEVNRIIVRIIESLRGKNSNRFMSPVDESSFPLRLHDAVFAFLVKHNVRFLTILVDGKFYHEFEVEPRGRDIAINLVSYCHWKDWTGSQFSLFAAIQEKADRNAAIEIRDREMAEDLAARDLARKLQFVEDRRLARTLALRARVR